MPNEKKEKAPMPQIVIGGIVSTSLAKPSKDDDLFPYVVRDGKAKVGDLYAVIAGTKLGFLRVTKVVDFYEFLPNKINYYGSLNDIRDVITRIDIDTYKSNRHIKYVRADLEDALNRIVAMIDCNEKQGLDCGDLNDAAASVRAKIALLDKDPDAYKAKYEPENI